MNCPACGADAPGKFCMECGAAVAGQPCPSCDAPSQPGASFCIQCGQALGRRRRPRAKSASGAGWWVAWGLLGVAAVFVGLRAFRADPGPQPVPVTGTLPPATGPSSVDLSQMTPREAAERLFDRVMRTVSAGDTAGARNFVPMAIGAYDLVEDVDADGRYHVVLLHSVAGDDQAALEAAEAALQEHPDHLLLLGSAAEAASSLGDDARAAQLWGRLLEVWESEMARGLEEYTAHSIPLDEMRQAAEASAAP